MKVGLSSNASWFESKCFVIRCTISSLVPWSLILNANAIACSSDFFLGGSEPVYIGAMAGKAKKINKEVEMFGNICDTGLCLFVFGLAVSKVPLGLNYLFRVEC